MTIKQKVDKYLKDNYGDVVFETKIKGFRWQTIADKIGKDINKDVVKERWKVVKKKMEAENSIATSKFIAEKKNFLDKNENKIVHPGLYQKMKEGGIIIPNSGIIRVVEEEYIAPLTAKPITKQPWSFITFLKNLFKNL